MALQRSLMFLMAVLIGTAHAQMCTPGQAILKRMQLDTCRDALALVECTGKMQLSISQYCSAQLQPEMKIASDGTYCETSRGVQSRNTARGPYSMGRSDLEMELRNAGGGMILMFLKGRIVPDAGGHETNVDCKLLFNVTAGNALGVVSQGTDSLMGTTYTGPPMGAAGTGGVGSTYGGYSGFNEAAGQGLPGQQQMYPGQQVMAGGAAYGPMQQQQGYPYRQQQGEVSGAGDSSRVPATWLIGCLQLALLILALA